MDTNTKETVSLIKKKLLPLNLTLLSLTPEQLRTIRPVKTLDIFDGPGGNFHEDGLFSTLTFGRVGDPIRDLRFGYIDLKLPIFHPVIYSRLIKLKGLYAEILSGQGFATWDPETRDFVRSNELDGETGYAFFVKHWPELNPPKTGSSIRDLRVTLIEKYRKVALIDKLLVIPAGLRDVDIDVDGRPSMDEVNELYSNVLMLSRNFPDKPSEAELSIYDRTRFTLTLRILTIYEHFEKLISGKRGFIQGNYASRRVFNTTRNVLSSLDVGTYDLTAKNRPTFNDTVVGLYQASKGLLPKVVYSLKTSIVGTIFDTSSGNVSLVNPNTLMLEWVEISNEDLDRWSTEEGLEKVVNEISVIEKRDRPVMVGNHYLALIYNGVDKSGKKVYKIIRSITELPPELDVANVRPITYVELIYLADPEMWNKNHAFVTRYPVENYNSSYPTKMYVKTTIKGEIRYELNHDWELDETSRVALEYPILVDGVTTQYHDSTSVSPARLAPLGADFDGDTVSFNPVYSNEANAEAARYFKRREAYIKAGGGLAFSVNIHSVALALSFMTRDPD